MHRVQNQAARRLTESLLLAGPAAIQSAFITDETLAGLLDPADLARLAKAVIPEPPPPPPLPPDIDVLTLYRRRMTFRQRLWDSAQGPLINLVGALIIIWLTYQGALRLGIRFHF